jgi:hypothetical protein
MSAHYENRKPRTLAVMPEMAKEVIFWCAVFVVVVTSAVLIGQMNADWERPLPSSPAVALVGSKAISAGVTGPLERFSADPKLNLSEATEPIATF